MASNNCHNFGVKMQIILNGDPHQVQDRITLHELIDQLKGTHTNFAVALNQVVVPRSAYHEVWLHANDKVEVVTAFQGG